MGLWPLWGQLDRSPRDLRAGLLTAWAPGRLGAGPRDASHALLVTSEHVTAAHALLLPHKPPPKNLSNFTEDKDIQN